MKTFIVSLDRLKKWTARGVLVTHAWAATASAAVSPSDTLSVGRAVQLALAQGSDAVTADANRDQSRASLQSARAALLPHASMSFSGDLSTNRVRTSSGSRPETTVESTSDGWQSSSSLSWSLFDLSAFSAYGSARSSLRAAESEREDARLTIGYSVRRQFWIAVQAHHLATVAGESLALARIEEARAERLEHAGAVPHSDVLKARLQTAEALLDSLNARRSADVERLELLQLVGLPASSLLVLDTAIVLPRPVPDMASILAEARAARPDMRAAVLRLSAARSASDAARRSRIPALQLTGTSVHSHDRTDVENGLRTDTDIDRQWSGALALTQTMFDGGARRSRITSADAGLRTATNRRDAVERRIETEAREALLAWSEAQQRVEVALAREVSAEEQRRGTSRRYELGSATMLELVDAQLQLARARQSAIEARVAVVLADAQIARAAGRSEVSQ